MKTKNAKSCPPFRFKKVVADFVAKQKAEKEQEFLKKQQEEKKARDEAEAFKLQLTTLLASVNQNLKDMLSEKHGDPDFIEYMMNIMRMHSRHIYDDTTNACGFGLPENNIADPTATELVLSDNPVMIVDFHEIETNNDAITIVIALVFKREDVLIPIIQSDLKDCHFALLEKYTYPRTREVKYSVPNFSWRNEMLVHILHELCSVKSTYQMFLKIFGTAESL